MDAFFSHGEYQAILNGVDAEWLEEWHCQEQTASHLTWCADANLLVEAVLTVCAARLVNGNKFWQVSAEIFMENGYWGEADAFARWMTYGLPRAGVGSLEDYQSYRRYCSTLDDWGCVVG